MTTTLPLTGIKVLEISGLAPAPFAGMLLGDFGADVVRVDRASKGSVKFQADSLSRNKRSIALDLKSDAGRGAFKRMALKADVVIEPFRPGVMERLGLGPDVLCAANPKLVYARMTGFGQGGEAKVSGAAGHDINYIAVSGILSALRRQGDKPFPPINLLGDFAGGGMICAWGILLALFERHRSGRGQVVDAAMTDGASYISSFVWKAKQLGGWNNDHDGVGTNMLDSGAHFYDTYTCKDGKFMSVGAIEPQFYALLLQGLGLRKEELPHQMDSSKWPEMRQKFAQVFATKTRDEWASIFDGTDACCFPILSMEEATQYKHNQLRGTFVQNLDTDSCGTFPEPAPAPKLSRTPGRTPTSLAVGGLNTLDILREYGFSDSEVHELVSSTAAVSVAEPKPKL